MNPNDAGPENAGPAPRLAIKTKKRKKKKKKGGFSEDRRRDF